MPDLPENLAAKLIDQIMEHVPEIPEPPPYTFADLMEAIKSIPKDNRLIQGDKESLAAWSKIITDGAVEQEGTLISFAGIKVKQNRNVPPGHVAFTDGEQIVIWKVDL